MLDNDTPMKRKIDIFSGFFLVTWLLSIFWILTSIVICQCVITRNYFIWGMPPDLLFMIIDFIPAIFGFIWLFFRYSVQLNAWVIKIKKLPAIYKFSFVVLWLVFPIILRKLIGQ